MQADRDVIPDRAMGSGFVVVPTPSLQAFLRIRMAQENAIAAPPVRATMAIAAAHLRFADFPGPQFQCGLPGLAGLVVVARQFKRKASHARRIETAQSTNIPSTRFRVRAV